MGDGEEEQASGNKAQDDVFDGAGNKIDVKAQAALSEKDRKKKIKDLEKKIKDGKKKQTLTEEKAWGLGDALASCPGLQASTFVVFNGDSFCMQWLCLRAVCVSSDPCGSQLRWTT